MNQNNMDPAQEPATTIASRIPPHLAWPLFVVLLLVIGVGSSLAIVFAARSDGGAKVIENYYEKAIAWDSTSKLTRDSKAAGWIVSMQYVPPAAPAKTGSMEVVFIDGFTAYAEMTSRFLQNQSLERFFVQTNNILFIFIYKIIKALPELFILKNAYNF